jgi:hypothetical protein
VPAAPSCTRSRARQPTWYKYHSAGYDYHMQIFFKLRDCVVNNPSTSDGTFYAQDMRPRPTTASTPRGPVTSRATNRERTGRAFLVEDAGQPGLFQGSWQVDDEERERLGAADEQTALAWARERAEVVVIRLFESMPYSAGAINPWDGPAWPGLAEAWARPNMTAPPD